MRPSVIYPLMTRKTSAENMPANIAIDAVAVLAVVAAECLSLSQKRLLSLIIGIESKITSLGDRTQERDDLDALLKLARAACNKDSESESGSGAAGCELWNLRLRGWSRMVAHAGHVNDIFADMCRLGVRRTGESYDILSRNVYDSLDVPSAKYCFSMICDDLKKGSSMSEDKLRSAFACLMKTAVQCGDIGFAVRCLNFVIERGLADVEAVNALMQRYGTAGRVSRRSSCSTRSS